ncbi:MAG TPA: ComEC/Rec2 family competence protein [Chloroflexota bacterium]|nr:ComEC/Rec2 family competence protein [Chloroflexota bacterium]
MALIALSVGWLTGLLLAASGVTEIPLAAAFVLSAAAALRFRRVPHVVWLPVAVVGAALALVRFQAYQSELGHANVAAFTGRSLVRLRGIVATEPVPYGSGVQFTFNTRQLEQSDLWFPSSGDVQVRSDGPFLGRAGDAVEVDAVLAPPDPGLPAYLSPLQQQKIAAVANRATVLDLGSSAASPWLWLVRRREDAAAALDRALPEPEAGLARGIVLGESRTLDSSLAASFARTNTTHILAVDGYKVGLVASFADTILSTLLRPLLAAFGTTLGLVGYAVLVGGSPSALRATIMGGVFAIGQALGRPRDTLNALALAGLLIMAVNPFLLWNLAFQLSFLTTLGMALLAPMTQSWLPIGPNWLREAIGATLAAEIASAPLIAATFDQVSLVSLPVHAIVMPIVPVAIGLGAATAVLGMASPALGSLSGLLTWFPLAAVVGVVQWAGNLSFAALAVPPPGLAGVVGCYVALGLALFSRPNALGLPVLPLGRLAQRLAATPRARQLVPLLVLPILGIGYVFVPRAAPVDRISFLDVGIGDAALVDLRDGARVYLQGEAPAVSVARAVGPRLPFWNRSIDLAVLSVGSDPALTDLDDLAGRVPLREVVLTGAGYSATTIQHWTRTAHDGQIRSAAATSTVTVTVGQSARLVAYPVPGAPDQGRTAARAPSLAVRLSMGQASVLWASADPADQAQLVGLGTALHAQVLKLVGRGSRWGVDPRFFALVNPSIVVLSGGVAGQFAKATPGTLDLLDARRVYRTDLDGTVTVTLGNEKFTVETTRQ